MTTLKLSPDQIKLFDDLGISATFQHRKATILPYIFVRHNDQPPGEVELVSMVEAPKELYDYARLIDPNMDKTDVELLR